MPETIIPAAAEDAPELKEYHLKEMGEMIVIEMVIEPHHHDPEEAPIPEPELPPSVYLG
jgi:hypothetical protein